MAQLASISFGQSARSLATMFKGLPDKLQNGGMRRATTKAAKAVVNNVKPRIPRSAKKNERYAGKPHYQDVMSYKVKKYKDAAIAVAGPKSGQAPHAHLVEEGTQERFTKRTTQYRTVGTRRTSVVQKYTRADGKVRSRKVFVSSRVRRSIGSFVDVRKDGVSQSRGRMPAFKPQQKGFAAVKPIIKILIRDEMRASISKAAKGGA